MSTVVGRMVLGLEGEMAPAAPLEGPVRTQLRNAASGRRWADDASASANVIAAGTVTLAASGAQTLDLLAAGGLTDLLQATVDLDELKGIHFKCTAGSVSVAAAATGGVDAFTGASHGVKLSAGQAFAFDFGDDGLDVTTNSKITLTELSTTDGATVSWALIGEN